MKRIVTPLAYEIARLVSATENARWRPYDEPTYKRDFLAPRYRTPKIPTQRKAG